MKLYQFPLSHYCEKIRWAIEFKRLPYRRVSLLPGLHIKPMKKLSGSSNVPVLKDGKVVKTGSATIIDYLDENYPRFALTPSDPKHAAEARELEAYVDDKVGPAVRKLIYSVMLDHPHLLIPLFTYEGPWYGKFLLPRIFPRVREALIKRLPINEASLAEAQADLREAMARLLKRLEGKTYLVGESFSRADLAAAALWAPLWVPGKYGCVAPSYYPEKLQNLLLEFEALKPWVLSTYQRHRP